MNVDDVANNSNSHWIEINTNHLFARCPEVEYDHLLTHEIDKMSIPFDESILRLPSCLAVHSQLRSELNGFSTDDYVQYFRKANTFHVCGIRRKTDSETRVLAIAVYRMHLSTYDTIRFEIDDLVVDERERNHGLGTELLHYLVEQAKQNGVRQILIHCDPKNSSAHRFFFRHHFTIVVFEFIARNEPLLPSNDQIKVIDITDLPERENEALLSGAQDIFRQLRPHLPTDQKAYITQVRDICRTGPARMIVAMNHDDQQGEVLGLAVYRVTCNGIYSKHIYCDDLVTDENKRSSGVGRCLVNYMKNEGNKLGLEQLILDSGCQRGRAHKFYYREGFTINQFGFLIIL